MISFSEKGRRFQFRTAGIAVADGRALVHHAEFEDFWSFPGGRVEMEETAAEALSPRSSSYGGQAEAKGELKDTSRPRDEELGELGRPERAPCE